MNNFEEKRDVRFINICDFICDNYSSLKKEFTDIMNLLIMAEGYVAAYLKKKMAASHFKVTGWKCDTRVLSFLLDQVETLKEGARIEFVQQVDFINIFDVISREILSENAFVFIVSTKKKLDYMIYELDRLVSTEDKQKQVAILKGMIAYY